ERYPLFEGPTVIGRAQSCAVVINDESISRQHARLTVLADRVELTDLQSRNGTYVAGEAVRDATLKGGEALAFGDVQAVLEHEVAEAPTTAAPAMPSISDHTMI